METDQSPVADPGTDPADLLESMAVGYVRLETDWVVTHVNLAAERILGRRGDELVGRVIWEEYPGARELEFGRVYDAVMETRVPLTVDAYYPGLDLWFEQRVQPSAGGGIAVYFLDVTARRRADEQLAVTARHAAVIARVSAALGQDLDVAANVGALARLVLPELGTWSLVSTVDDDGGLVDAGSWHVDPARRAEVARYARVRLTAYDRESFGTRAVRSAEPVVLDDATREIAARLRPGEARDLLHALRPQTALMVPMIARGRVVGLLSLFGDATTAPSQRVLAREVADRAALAIDNSASYERARRARAEAEAAGQRLALLARASETLAVSQDLEQAVGRLAQLVVPQLADWSIVTIVDDDGNIRDTGWAHRDPAHVPDVAAYARHRSAVMTPDSPLATVLRTGEPVVIERVTEGVVASAVADPAVARMLDCLQPYGAVLAPLSSHGRVLGAITLVTEAGRGSHTPAQVQTALEVAARAGAVLDSARSASRAQRLAESVQRSMLVIAQPGPGLRVATRYRAAYVDRQVGGDWYDTFQRSDGPTVVTIGDVMGHDVAAISAMAQLRTVMRATAWSLRHSPAEVLRTTDEISAQLGPGTFATVVTAEVRPAPDGSAQLRWANAGHLPPAVIAPDGTVSLLRTEVIDPPLGVRPATVRHDHETVLAAGSTLVLYTDGLIERRGDDLETRLLDLSRVLRDLAGEDLETLLDGTIQGLAAAGERDDVALLALRIACPPPGTSSAVACPRVDIGNVGGDPSTEE